MEAGAGSWAAVVVLVLLQFTDILAQNEPKYFEHNSTLSLSPTAVSAPISSILWRHGENLVAEWIKGAIELQYYGAFANRTELNITTGHLHITRATKADMGTFSVEINNVAQANRYEAKIVQKVPNPYVWVKPGPNPDLYHLYCDAVQGQDALKAAEPISYWWKIGTANWVEFGHRLEINVNETTQNAKTFACRMVNPVSDKTSEPKENPFYGSVLSPGLAVGVAVGVCAFLAVLGGSCVAYKKKKFPFNRTGTVPVSSSEDKLESNKLNPSAEPENGSAKPEDGSA